MLQSMEQERRAKWLPDFVACLESDPLGDGTVLLERLGQLLLHSERLMRRLETQNHLHETFNMKKENYYSDFSELSVCRQESR